MTEGPREALCPLKSCQLLHNRDVQWIGNPNGNGSPMAIPWEWDKY